jgi:hypothetical protein
VRRLHPLRVVTGFAGVAAASRRGRLAPEAPLVVPVAETTDSDGEGSLVVLRCSPPPAAPRP